MGDIVKIVHDAPIDKWSIDHLYNLGFRKGPWHYMHRFRNNGGAADIEIICLKHQVFQGYFAVEDSVNRGAFANRSFNNMGKFCGCAPPSLWQRVKGLFS